jgi:hemin uptake protein HemP
MHNEEQSGAPERKAGDRHPPVPRVSSRQLLKERGEIIIEHEGREYRLRITHNGKLILTA